MQFLQRIKTDENFFVATVYAIGFFCGLIIGTITAPFVVIGG